MDWSKERAASNLCGYCTDSTSPCNGDCFTDVRFNVSRNRVIHLEKEAILVARRFEEILKEYAVAGSEEVNIIETEFESMNLFESYRKNFNQLVQLYVTSVERRLATLEKLKELDSDEVQVQLWQQVYKWAQKGIPCERPVDLPSDQEWNWPDQVGESVFVGAMMYRYHFQLSVKTTENV